MIVYYCCRKKEATVCRGSEMVPPTEIHTDDWKTVLQSNVWVFLAKMTYVSLLGTSIWPTSLSSKESNDWSQWRWGSWHSVLSQHFRHPHPIRECVCLSLPFLLILPPANTHCVWGMGGAGGGARSSLWWLRYLASAIHTGDSDCVQDCWSTPGGVEGLWGVNYTVTLHLKCLKAILNIILMIYVIELFITFFHPNHF